MSLTDVMSGAGSDELRGGGPVISVATFVAIASWVLRRPGKRWRPIAGSVLDDEHAGAAPTLRDGERSKDS